MRSIEQLKKECQTTEGDSFEVTAEEFQHILCESETRYYDDGRPRPPVKARASGRMSGGGGFFAGIIGVGYTKPISGSFEYEERDYHAPEYLEALKAWKAVEAMPKVACYYGKKLVIRDSERLEH